MHRNTLMPILNVMFVLLVPPHACNGLARLVSEPSGFQRARTILSPLWGCDRRTFKRPFKQRDTRYYTTTTTLHSRAELFCSQSPLFGDLTEVKLAFIRHINHSGGFCGCFYVHINFGFVVERKPTLQSSKGTNTPAPVFEIKMSRRSSLLFVWNCCFR